MAAWRDYNRLPTSTWAARPTSGVATGARLRISDYGISPGLVVVWDGTRWIPDGVQILDRYNQQLSHTGDTNETTKRTVTVPGGLLGTNGSLEISGLLSAGANNANGKNARIRFGGTIFSNVSLASALSFMLSAPIVIANRNSASSQIGTTVGSSIVSGSSGSLPTGAIDTSADQSLTFTLQLGNGTDTVSWERILVKACP